MESLHDQLKHKKDLKKLEELKNIVFFFLKNKGGVIV